MREREREKANKNYEEVEERRTNKVIHTKACLCFCMKSSGFSAHGGNST